MEAGGASRSASPRIEGVKGLMSSKGRNRVWAALCAPLLAAGCTWGGEPPAAPQGEPPLIVTVGARDVSLRPRQSSRLDARVAATVGTPAGTSLAIGYRTADSCIAAVSADGVVTAGSFGRTVVEAYALAAPLTARASVEVSVLSAPGPSLTIQSVTAGDPPVAVDITQPISGTITVTVIVDVALAVPGARLDLSLDGRPVGSAPVVASTGPVVSLPFVVNTAARDPVTGAKSFPDGTRPLRGSVSAPPVAGNPGCAPITATQATFTQTLQLRNS